MNTREVFEEKYKVHCYVPNHELGEMCTGCASFNNTYVKYLKSLKDQILEALIKLNERLKKYHNLEKEPDIIELMEIIENGEFILQVEGKEIKKKEIKKEGIVDMSICLKCGKIHPTRKECSIGPIIG